MINIRSEKQWREKKKAQGPVLRYNVKRHEVKDEFYVEQNKKYVTGRKRGDQNT